MDSRFSWAETQKLKADGVDRAAQSHICRLELARTIARTIAIQDGAVTADDVGKQLARYGIPTGPWAGAIFRGSEWEFTGKWVASQRATNHGRMLRVWRLTPATQTNNPNHE